jgi:hypothetical protein
MWECYNCNFNNVDASVLCAKCRTPKPDPNQPRQGRSFATQQLAAQERVADTMRAMTIPPPPTQKRMREDWLTLLESGDKAALANELAQLEQRSYAIREALRLVVNVLKTPQARGNDVQLQTVIQTLIDWEAEML